MKKLMIVLIVMSLTACSFDDITYSKDSRTGLCFAHQTSMTNNGSLIDSITNVPCEKAEGLITK